MVKKAVQASELKELAQPSLVRTTLMIAFDWTLIVGIFTLVMNFPFIWVYPIAFLLLARQQLALGVLLHEAVHGRITKSRILNDLLGQIFLASPLLLSLYAFKTLHLKHHETSLTVEDPEFGLYTGFPASRKIFFKTLLRDLVGITYFQHLSKLIIEKASVHSLPDKDLRGPFEKEEILFMLVGVQASMFGVFSFIGHPFYYFFLWLLPLVTLVPLLHRLRTAVEHGEFQLGLAPAFGTRTVLNQLESFFLAPHNANYHIEHHLYPNVPFFNMPALHQRLKEAELLPSSNIQVGYLRILTTFLRREEKAK